MEDGTLAIKNNSNDNDVTHQFVAVSQGRRLKDENMIYAPLK